MMPWAMAFNIEKSISMDSLPGMMVRGLAVK